MSGRNGASIVACSNAGNHVVVMEEENFLDKYVV